VELGFRVLCREDSSVQIAEVEFEDRLEVFITLRWREGVSGRHCVSGLVG
jgi:hypothetical protein